MKRKVLSILLMAVMVCSLAACGSKETKTSKETSEDKVLKVAMECGYAPYNWTQSDDSNGAVQITDSKDYAYGYDVMIAKK